MKIKNTGKPTAFTLLELLILIAVLTILGARIYPSFTRAKQKVAQVNCGNNLRQVAVACRIWASGHNDYYPMAMAGQRGGPPHAIPAVNSTFYYTFETFQVMSNECGAPNVLVCPADERRPRTNFSNTTSGGDFNNNQAVSYFYCQYADSASSSVFLAGDRAIATSVQNMTGYGVSARGSLNSGVVLSLGTNFANGAQFPQWTQALHEGLGNVALTDGSVRKLDSQGLRLAAQCSGDPTGNILVFP